MAERRRQYKKVCAICGKEYMAKMQRSMYCSEECHQEARKRAGIEKTGVRNRICPICGVNLPYHKHKYCSERCASIGEQGCLMHSEPVKRICENCGKEYIGSTHKPNQKYCSKACCDAFRYKPPIGEDGLTPLERLRANQADVREQKQVEKEKQRIARIRTNNAKMRARQGSFKYEYYSEIKECEYCGGSFITYPYQLNQKYCSKKCAAKANKGVIHGRIERRVKSPEKLIDKDITVRRLFKRDNGICYLCGGKCDFDDKQYITGRDGRQAFVAGENYPSIDHVVPLAKGGEHSWDNVRLAHFKCNSLKRDSLLDEVI